MTKISQQKTCRPEESKMIYSKVQELKKNLPRILYLARLSFRNGEMDFPKQKLREFITIRLVL